MNDVGISAYGGYVPRLRLSRESAVRANDWVDPSLMMNAKSERSMCDVDEDSVTMAVEAARDCLQGVDLGSLDSLYFASTTFPFLDRQNSTIIAEALALKDDVETLDIASSQRAGTSGLICALKTAANSCTTLYVSADCRKTKAGTANELLFGDGAAALALGTQGILAKFIGSVSLNRDFVDHFRGDGSRYDTYFEQRWIREEGYLRMVPDALQALFKKTGIAPEDVTHFIMPCVIRGVREVVAKRIGIPPERIRNDLAAGCGETGTAHPLVMLVDTLEEAKPDEMIVMVGFGQGVDALAFRTTSTIDGFAPRRGIKNHLANGVVEKNYQKFLSFRNMVEIDWGMRAEAAPKARPSAAWRKHKEYNALVGGRCMRCGTIQFPMAHICVNPECQARDSQENYRLADSTARIVSYTVDRLAYSPHPPLVFGIIEFEEGARFLAQFTGCDPETVTVDAPMEMVFRIKKMERERNFRTYFWKATPLTNRGKEK